MLFIFFFNELFAILTKTHDYYKKFKFNKMADFSKKGNFNFSQKLTEIWLAKIIFFK